MTKPKPRILVVGSSNTDMIVRLERIPRPGETVIGGEFTTARGGKGANQAVAAARAGGDVTFVARLGQDAFGDQAMVGFMADAIHTDHVVRDQAVPSGVAFIFVTKNGENSIAVASGANAKLSAADVRKAKSAFAGSDALLLQLESPLRTVQTAAKLAARVGVRIILNPAPAQPLPNELLRLVSVLTPNETEAELLTGIEVKSLAGAEKAADKLLHQGVGAVTITLGSRGAWVASEGVRQLVPGFRVKAVDTTAAGDTFNGALAVGLSEGMLLTEAVLFANAAAAISVTRMGAQPSAPARAEIKKIMKLSPSLATRRSRKTRPGSG